MVLLKHNVELYGLYEWESLVVKCPGEEKVSLNCDTVRCRTCRHRNIPSPLIHTTCLLTIHNIVLTVFLNCQTTYLATVDT